MSSPLLVEADSYLSEHARLQASRRRIPVDLIALALCRGLQIQQNGAVIYHLGRRSLPPELPHELAARAEGITVVESRDGRVLTAYRARRVPRRMRQRRPRR